MKPLLIHFNTTYIQDKNIIPVKRFVQILMLVSIIILLNYISYADEKLSVRPNFNTEFSSQAGKLSANNIYLSYLSLDLIYERLLLKQLDKKNEKKLINSLYQINQGLEDNLKILYSLVESDKDAKFIYKLVSITKLLKENSANLIKYIEDKEEKSLKKFYESHLNIWIKLKELFAKK